MPSQVEEKDRTAKVIRVYTNTHVPSQVEEKDWTVKVIRVYTNTHVPSQVEESESDRAKVIRVYTNTHLPPQVEESESDRAKVIKLFFLVRGGGHRLCRREFYSPSYLLTFKQLLNRFANPVETNFYLMVKCWHSIEIS